MDFKLKYIKYKKKYVDIKNNIQIGGSSLSNQTQKEKNKEDLYKAIEKIKNQETDDKLSSQFIQLVQTNEENIIQILNYCEEKYNQEYYNLEDFIDANLNADLVSAEFVQNLTGPICMIYTCNEEDKYQQIIDSCLAIDLKDAEVIIRGKNIDKINYDTPTKPLVYVYILKAYIKMSGLIVL